MVLERRVSRRKISLSALPAWPQWHFQESKNQRTNIPSDEVALGLDGRSVVYQAIRPGLSAFCHVETPILPLAQDIESCVPLDQWPSQGEDIDMAPQVDLKILGERYNQALFGSPIPIFVKSALARARVGVEPSALQAALRSLCRTPSQLDEFYGPNHTVLANPQFKESMDTWRSANMSGKPLPEVLDALLKRETQLQVAVYLELHSHDHSVEPVLDQHFDRLCIWQAVDVLSRGNAVVDFCTDVVMPYFRGTSPLKSRELLRRARGLSYGAVAPVARKRSSLTTEKKPKKRLQPSQLLLARAQAVTQNEPEPKSTAKANTKSATAKRSQSMGAQTLATSAHRALSLGNGPASRTNSSSEARRNSSMFQRLVSNRDMVEVSFRRSSSVQAQPEPEESKPAPAPAPKNSLAARSRRQPPKPKPSRNTTLVQATPSTVRTVLLENTDKVPLSFDDEGIDSTDSD